MLSSVFSKSLRDLRRSFAWWALGLAGYVALIVSVYPTIRDNPDLNKLVESYPEALKAFIAFVGFAPYSWAGPLNDQAGVETDLLMGGRAEVVVGEDRP